jgi:peptide/nickel transport system substrate-binding protein
MPNRRSVFVSLLLLLTVTLASCGPRVTAAPTPTATPPAATSTPAPTTVPLRTLTICLGEEPASLYPFGSLSTSARSILAAVYDGPLDTNSYGYQPVLLEKLPSLADGDAQISAASVYVGDEVVDAAGTPVTLAVGARVRPSGCRADDCAIVYDGRGEIQMDQMVVNFRLRPGLYWSDGMPLTVADSVYAYNLATYPDTPAANTPLASIYMLDRTRAYEAVDEQTAQWWSKPGYLDPTYFANFWTPYPKHLWSQYMPGELPETEIAARKPVGWGAYVIRDWASGDAITLTKNPYYFRADEGLPKFDILVFRFVAAPEAAISELLAGKCDLLDPSLRLEGQASLLRTFAAQGQLAALFAPTDVMERLDFGIRPASYDNGYQPEFGDRLDFLSDKRVRQAIALCLDRQQAVDTVLYGLTTAPAAFVPAGHPLFNPDVKTYAFDAAAAGQLLEQAGWRDVDNDPATPRQAWGIANIPAGTPLILNYWTTGAAQRRQVSEILAGSLAKCGILVNLQYYDPTELYAPGPDGPLFGRRFDLAEFAMGSTGVEPACEWFTSAETPGATNRWIGVNVSGYANAAYDAACLSAKGALPGEAAYAGGYAEAQAIFAEDLPIVPLYWRLKVAASRPDFCNFSLDPSAGSDLWNIEAFDYGAACAP